MKRRRRSAPSFGLALMDLLSCAFAGVIVLTVVLSAMLGSSRAIEERSFLILDITVSALDGSKASPKHRQAIDQLELGIELRGPDWKAIWQDEEEKLPIRDSEVTVSVLAGSTHGETGRRHLTVLVRGLTPGPYDAIVEVAHFEPDRGPLKWPDYRQELENQLVQTEIEAHYPGGEGETFTVESIVSLHQPLWKKRLVLDLDN